MSSVVSGFIFEVLDPVGVVLTIILSVPVFWTWWEVIFGRKRRQKRWLKDISHSSGARPAILVVDLKTDLEIWPQVQQSRQQNDLLKKVPDDRIVHVKHGTWLKPEDMGELVEKLRKSLGTIAEFGTDVLYLIYAGPLTPAAIIGAELANCYRVILFQYQQGTYVNWGPLKHYDIHFKSGNQEPGIGP